MGCEKTSISAASRGYISDTMKLTRRLLAFVLAIQATFVTAGESDEAGWISLFNGRDFTGWTFDVQDGSPPADIWSVEDGIIQCRGAGKSAGVLRTQGSHANYEVEVEWRWPARPGNCGVLVHCSSPRRMGIWPQCLEVQLAHENAGDFWTIGETIEVPKSQILDPQSRRRLNFTNDSEKPAGEWNRMRVRAEGNTLIVHVNDELVNVGIDGSAWAGALCLQAEGADVQFRTVRIRSLDSDPRNIVHSVFFRLKHPAGSAAEKAFFEAAEVLAEIHTVRNLRVLRETSPKNDFDFGFSMEFASQADYDFYNQHPDHQKFVQDIWLKEVADFQEIDYLVNNQ